MKDIGWDAYQIFTLVARHGGLVRAAQASGLSSATVGRRVLDLEQRTGRQLFVRSQTGYRLTADGQTLLVELSEMEAAARRIDGWRAQTGGISLVRLTAGTWVAWLICENIAAVWTERDPFRLDLSVSERRAALSHRENDVGIRAVEPQEMHLTSRKAAEVAYAAYRRRNSFSGTGGPWIAVGEEDAISPYLRWPHENDGGSIGLVVSRPRSLLDLARAGAGRAVLPCFVGDLDPDLERTGEEIRDIRHGLWIVTNSEDRHRRDIRTVSERIYRLVKSHGDLFAGRRASRTA